jgi:hypothetical protein
MALCEPEINTNFYIQHRETCSVCGREACHAEDTHSSMLLELRANNERLLVELSLSLCKSVNRKCQHIRKGCRATSSVIRQEFVLPKEVIMGTVSRNKITSLLLAISIICRSQWSHSLRRGSAAVRLRRLRDRIPPGAWMSVTCKCCVLSGTVLCVGLINRPEESYRL